jgi:hypothetical protein
MATCHDAVQQACTATCGGLQPPGAFFALSVAAVVGAAGVGAWGVATTVLGAGAAGSRDICGCVPASLLLVEPVPA